MNELNTFYSTFVKSLGCMIEKDWTLHLMVNGTANPVTLREMSVYLPTKEALRKNTMEKVFFHPACESIISKETEVFKGIVRVLISHKLLEAFIPYFDILREAAVNANKKKLNTATLELLKPFEVSKKAHREEVHRLLAALTVHKGENDNVDNRFISFNITKGGKSRETGDKVYYRTKPTFPAYNEMVRAISRVNKSNKAELVDVNGVSVSVEGLELAIHLFESVLPGVKNPDEYEFEYCKPDAARLASLLGSYVLVVDDMNSVQNKFREYFNKAHIYAIDTSWYPMLDNIDNFYDEVGPLNYNNQGSDKPIKHRSQTTEQLFGTVSTQPTVQQPQYPNQPTQYSTSYGPNGEPVAQEPQYPNYLSSNANESNPNQDMFVPHVTGQVNIKRPMLRVNERYVRADIEPSGMVSHLVMDNLNNQIIYRCSRYGNILERIQQQMMPQNIAGYGGQQPVFIIANPGAQGLALGATTQQGNGIQLGGGTAAGHYTTTLGSTDLINR